MWSESKGGKLCEWTLRGGKVAEHVAWAADLNAKTHEVLLSIGRRGHLGS